MIILDQILKGDFDRHRKYILNVLVIEKVYEKYKWQRSGMAYFYNGVYRIIMHDGKIIGEDESFFGLFMKYEEKFKFYRIIIYYDNEAN
jgi:hypothetical protein